MRFVVLYYRNGDIYWMIPPDGKVAPGRSFEAKKILINMRLNSDKKMPVSWPIDTLETHKKN